MGAGEVGGFSGGVGAVVVGEGDDAPAGSCGRYARGCHPHGGRCYAHGERTIRGGCGGLLKGGWLRGPVFVRGQGVGQEPCGEEKEKGGQGSGDPEAGEGQGVAVGWDDVAREVAGDGLGVGCAGALGEERERKLCWRGQRFWCGCRGLFWSGEQRCGGGGLVGAELAAEGGADVFEVPGTVESVADDLAVGSGEGGFGEAGEGVALGEGLEEDGGEVVDVALLEGSAVVAFRGLADAVAAEFDDAVDGEDVARLDVLVDEAVDVEDVEGGDEAGG